jgi:capsular exopolysaccharide synthesis family protein
MSQHREIAETVGAASMRDYLAILRFRKWSVILATIVALGSALGLSFLMTPVYSSHARVLVDAPSFDGAAASTIPNLETERELVSSVAVAEIVAERVSYRGDLEDLLRDVSVSIPTGTEILDIEYQHPVPIRARRVAQAFAVGYLEFRQQQALDELLAASTSVQSRLEQLQERLGAVNAKLAAGREESERVALEAEAATIAGQIALLQQQLSELSPAQNLRVGEIIQPADLASEPSSPNYLLNGLFGLFVGLSLGLGLALLRERLDDSLRGRGDLEERAGVPVLAAIQSIGSWRKRQQPRTVTLDEPRSAAAEAYKTLRTGLLFMATQREIGTILVTSPHAGEGKTATTANLGVALASTGRDVTLVSADLRKPRLERFFSRDHSPGLTNVLAGEVSADEVTAESGIEGLRVVSSGPIPGNPAELLGSDAMGQLLVALKGAADLILIDGPPVLVAADALVLASIVDGVLLVVDAQTTTRSAVMHARREMEQVDAPLLGAVLNRFDASRASGYPYYHQYYRYETPRRDKAEAQRSMWAR